MDNRDNRDYNDSHNYRDHNREYRERRDNRDRDYRDRDRDYRDRDRDRRGNDELYSQSIPAGKRRYFFDVKSTRGGDKFITITESRRLFDNRSGEFYYDKNKMFLYKEDFEKFRKGLENAFSFIETGIVPPPVVVEDEYDESRETNKTTPDLDNIDLDNIDLNF